MIQDLLAKFGITEALAGDAYFLGIFLAASIAFGMFIGRFRLINVLINIYIAIAILTVMPEEIFYPYSMATIFFFVFAVVILTMIDSHLFDIHISGNGGSLFWRLFVMSFFEAGLIFSVFLSLWDWNIVLKFISEDIYFIFTSQYMRIFWMLAPLLVLFFINKKEK